MNNKQEYNINEDNLNALHLEVSQYLDDEDLIADEVINELSNQDLESNTNTNIMNQLNNNPMNQLNINNQGGLNSNVNTRRSYLEKESTLAFLSSANKEKDNLIDSLKKNLQLMKDKASNSAKLKHQNNLLSKHIEELENELNLMKVEYIKLQETTSNKDNIIHEFQNLSDVTKNKFKMFEEANRYLKEENDSLRRSLDEANGKMIPGLLENEKFLIISASEQKLKYEKMIEEINLSKSKLEDNFKIKYEEKFLLLKSKNKEREEKLKLDLLKEISSLNSNSESLKIENEKLKMEIKNLKNKIEESEIKLGDKDNEMSKLCLDKDREYEKLKKNMREFQREIQELDSKYLEKQLEYNLKLKSTEDNLNKNLLIVNEKERKIKELSEEVNNLDNLFQEMQNLAKEYEIKLENKDKVINELKNQNSEILRELHRKDKESNQLNEIKCSELEELKGSLQATLQSLNESEEENEELRLSLLQASEKLQEMNDLVLDKYQGLEFNYNKEKNQRENTERKYKEIIRKLKDNEESLLNEINFMREADERKEQEFEGVKLKQENKIQKLKLKLEELKIKNENLDEIPSNLKSASNPKLDDEFTPYTAYTTASNNKNKNKSVTNPRNNSVNIPNIHNIPNIQNFTQRIYSNDLMSNEISHKQTLDNLKNLISQIDDKIGINS